MQRRVIVPVILATIPLAAFQVSRDLMLEIADVQAAPAPGTSKRYALVVGVSSYQNLPPRSQLKFAHRDAEAYAQFLRGTEGGALASSQIRVLTEEQASVSAIRAALREWLQPIVGPRDVVYLFLAGHGVVGDGNEAYFVANDSDPQNLHATGLSFRELNQAISQLKAGMVVLVADACHSGSIGWGPSSETAANANAAFDAIGSKDRLTLKLLASAPSERSFEDARWGGGHGAFTYTLLEGLRGGAERDADGVVRAAELIDYVSKVVPEQTGAKQNPRIAGNFEPRLALALLSRSKKPAPSVSAVNFRGPAGASVYLDNLFRGVIRPSGELRVEPVPAGPRRLSVDLPGGQSLEQTLNVPATLSTVDISRLPGVSLVRLQSFISRGAVIGPNSAWEYFKAAKFSPDHRAAATAMVAGALESLGQACVSDYVQSTSNTLKRAMLLRAVDGYEALKSLRPYDLSLEAKQRFCMGRAQIAANEFADAEQSLRASLGIDKNFACAHNALGVALMRQGRHDEARASFDRAAQLTPQWSLPFFQIGQQLMNRDKVKQAIPYLEKAAEFNPKSVVVRWTLMRANRTLNRRAEVERLGKELVALDPNYAPTYLELGMHYDEQRDYARATLAYEAYLLLAPNFADSAQVRQRAGLTRNSAGRKQVTLFPN